MLGKVSSACAAYMVPQIITGLLTISSLLVLCIWLVLTKGLAYTSKAQRGQKQAHIDDSIDVCEQCLLFTHIWSGNFHLQKVKKT
jgi:hypothetical protein